MKSETAKLSIGVTSKARVEWLRLDRENPRLIGVDSKGSDERIISQLYRSQELGELLQSIAANGYLDIEPLIVLRERDGTLTVLEGNRRLAAVRLFREPDLAVRVGKVEKTKIPVPEISDEIRRTLDEVSVHRVAERADALAFIGFKHINGAAKWESYAKAKYAAEWYRTRKISLKEISDKVGDNHDTIKRMVAAIYVLEQAEREGVFSIEERSNPKFNFSHLYTALSRTPYMNYLGLETAWSRYDPHEAPVPKDRLEKLREILVWIYGSKPESLEPVVQSQNPDIKRLGEALENKEALHVLRAGGTLEAAHSSTRSAVDKLSDALINARHHLREASNSIRGFDGRDTSLVDIAEDNVEASNLIMMAMRKKLLERREGTR